MTAYPEPYGYSAPPPPPSSARAARPAALDLAVAGGFAVAVLMLLSAVIGLASGRAALEDELTDGVGADLKGAFGRLAAFAVDEAYGTLRTRSLIMIVVAVAVALLALAARRASVGARAGLLVVLVIGLLVTGRVVTDVYPVLGTGLGWLAVLLSVAVAVLLFLPPVNRYRTSLRDAGGPPAPPATPPGGGYRPVR